MKFSTKDLFSKSDQIRSLYIPGTNCPLDGYNGIPRGRLSGSSSPPQEKKERATVAKLTIF